MTHEELRDILTATRSIARKFESNAHLGQPLRSWMVYGQIIDHLAPYTTRPREEFTDDRWGLSQVRDRLLYLSKNCALDREAVADICRQVLDQVPALIEQAKASRP